MSKKISNRRYSITQRIPLYWVIIIALTAALPYNLYLNHFNIPIAHSEEVVDQCQLPYHLIRDNTNKLTHPLLLVNMQTEDQDLMPLKEKMNTYITEKKANNVLKSAAIYFKILNPADGWFAINSEEKFNPASLMKIAFMMSMLKEAENNPAILDKKVYYAKHSQAFHDQAILEHQLPPGNAYSIRDLLYYAIAYSDNDAAFQVVDNYKPGTLSNLTSELNLPPVDFHTEYYLTVEEMSRYFRVLYNSSYLSNDMSEYALELLSKSDFDNGIVKKLDKNIVVARKFGERGLEDKELHEFGIVYLKGNPYLLGIMTRGNDYKQLEEVISEISLMAYDEMAKPIL